MKQIFQFFRNCLKSKLARLFFAANFILCIFIFNWSKCFSYLEKIHETGCPPRSGGKLDLSSYALYGDESVYISIFVLIISLLAIIFFLPSFAATIWILQILEKSLPGLCPETLDLISVPVFAVINAGYWILLGYFIESTHSNILNYKTVQQNPLSIYSGD